MALSSPRRSSAASLGVTHRSNTTPQTALREWAYLRPYYIHLWRSARILPGWLEHYNCGRPHGSLGKQSPMSRLPGGNNLMLVHT